jgi:hypothetical protein
LRKEVFAPWFEGVSNMKIIWDQLIDGMERGTLVWCYPSAVPWCTGFV